MRSLQEHNTSVCANRSDDPPDEIWDEDECCPECGSTDICLITIGGVRVECDGCAASYSASRERLIEACLLSHKDATEAKS